MKSATRLLVSIAAFTLVTFQPNLRGQTTPILTTLHSFTRSGTDGAYPFAGLVQGSDGNFYGTTNEGGGIGDGTYGDGTVFRMTPTGVYTTLHSFTGSGPDGLFPEAGLIQGRDGNFYSTTEGDNDDFGTVFRITSAGVLTTLHTFTGSGGSEFSYAALVQGSDGNFYGTTTLGGSSGIGTVFRMTPAGVLTTLHTFTGSGPDGAFPEAGLIQGRDGNFYSTTEGGGSANDGTVFRITPAGVLTTLYSFTDSGTDGAIPYAGLVQGSDGNFYGTTYAGGSAGLGTVFRLTLPPPVITSATAATATVGRAFSYRITATNDPTRYGVQGLPSSLSVNTETGVITGTPTAAGTIKLTLNAYDNGGKGSATLTLTIAAAGTPYITSALTLAVPEDTAFSYQITATDSPTSFGVMGLPSGVTVDPKMRLVTGKHHGLGTVTLTLNASNAKGKGSAYLTFSVYGAPIITSASTATATVGQPFTYQITARNSPTSFGVQGLRDGLTVDEDTGLISGTPEAAGTVTLTLNAYNGAGKGSATLTLDLTEP